MQSNIKIIVAHPGRQHSFRVATALKKSGLLFKYVTTVYDKDDSFLMKVVKIFISKENRKRASRRKCPGLPDDDVIQFCEFSGLLLLLLLRIDSTHRISDAFTNYISRRFQRKLAKYIIRNDVDCVISYDTNSSVLFSILKEKVPDVWRVMDNAHPNRHFLYYSYRENIDSCGPFLKTLEACGFLTDEAYSERFGDEARLATHHIVASSYSEKALLFDGVDKNRIFKIPYGVDEDKFIEPRREYVKGCLSVLFLGEVNQRKGIRQILEAAKMINDKNITFNIVGSGANHHSELYIPYLQYVSMYGYLPYEKMLDQLRTNHLFVFPTMGEGFGLVLLETMAAGLVPITTENCAGRDIIEHGIDGFIVPVGDSDAIVKIIKWCCDNPQALYEMGQRARRKAQLFTWKRYENGIVSAMCSILGN